MKKIVALVAGLIFGANAVVAQDQIDFRVQLPASWKLVSHSVAERLWVYESRGGEHRLSVSILYYSKEPSHEQQRLFLEDFVRTRQAQSSKLAKNLEFSDLGITEYEAAWVAKFGESSESGRLATSKVISSKIGIANFYLESLSSRAVHEKVGEKILRTTGFAS